MFPLQLFASCFRTQFCSLRSYKCCSASPKIVPLFTCNFALCLLPCIFYGTHTLFMLILCSYFAHAKSTDTKKLTGCSFEIGLEE